MRETEYARMDGQGYAIDGAPQPPGETPGLMWIEQRTETPVYMRHTAGLPFSLLGKNMC